MPKTSALSVDSPQQQPLAVSDTDTALAAKRLVYADLLDAGTGKGDSETTTRKVNCIPKPVRTQYATIKFPEVNI